MTTHTTQLTGIATQAVDCGPASVRTAISWATRDKKVPSIKAIRRRMGKTAGTTNPTYWQKCIESFDTPRELAGKYERLTGTRLSGDSWGAVETHLRDGGMAILAVDYGVWRRTMPRKSGSLSFSGYHAIPVRGVRDGRTKSFDPLLDGRYPGCPDGPVWVPLNKVEQATKEVGRKEVGRPIVYAYLMDRATRLGSGVDPEPPDDDDPTLASILADLREIQDQLDSADLGWAIDELVDLIGPYRGEADPEDDAKTGVTK